jgi:uncharacterized protein Yka (UPF0111/DUF47 family)
VSINEKEKDELLKIFKQIQNSSALNGGFDKLVLTVEHIKKKQEEQSEKLDKLYDPDTGLFSRVKELENDLQSLDKHFSRYIDNNMQNFDKIEKKLEKIESVNKTATDALEITKKIQRITGEDLHDLNKTIELQKKISNIYWALITVVITGFLNIVWQMIKNK